MSSNLYVTVDTEPMADRVHRVSHHVDATIAAIVAMETATVAAENAASNHICENVNRGFHSLLLSQVSQKCAKAKSIVDAKLQELIHMETSLRRVKDQMERDFHRIANRYHKTFKNLDNAMRARIYELDKPATDLTIRQMPEAKRRMLSSGVQAPIHQSESLSAAQSIISSAMRKCTMKTLGHMHGMLQKTATLQSTMVRIIDEEPIESSAQLLIPVIMFESDDLNMTISVPKVYIPEEFSKIEKNMQEAFRTVEWVLAEPLLNSVREQAELILSKGSLSDRVRTKALELLSSVNCQQTQGCRV
jgi:hypothetical protein